MDTFEISPGRSYLQHFLTRWRTLSISPEMVEKLKAASQTDPYAAYGYGRWLSLVNPGGNSLKEAEDLLSKAGEEGVPDAKAALAELFFEGRTQADESMPAVHARLMHEAYNAGSELAQYQTLLNTIFGRYAYPRNPAMVADILQKHLDKNPGSDPIYYDLLGCALEEIPDIEAAKKAYNTALERGEMEAYYSLASLFDTAGDWEQACRVAREGALKGAVSCRRFKAGMDEEAFEKLSPKEQKALHQEIAEGLDFAIGQNDRNASFLKASHLFMGNLGYPKDSVQAVKVLERGCEMGVANCYWLKAAIQHDDAASLPPELRLSPEEYAKTCLQAVRLGDREPFSLEEVARGYVSGTLSKYSKEIEKLWLDKFQEANPEEIDGKDATGMVAVYPQGFYYAMDVESEEDLDFSADVVHFSPLLTRITRALGLDKEGCHVAMLVEKDGYMQDLPDNMPGTIIYGNGYEIRGTVIFAMEEDAGYALKPFKGLQRTWKLLLLLDAATGGLIRQPTEAELHSIGV